MSTIFRSPAQALKSPFADPIAELRFIVMLGSIFVGRFRECTGIAVEVEMKEYTEGGLNDYVHKLPTRTKYPNVVLKRGLTHETALLKWLDKMRKDPPSSWQQLTIMMLGPGAVPVRSWQFMDAYPVKWTGPNLNAGSNQIATETLEIVHKGFKEA